MRLETGDWRLETGDQKEQIMEPKKRKGYNNPFIHVLLWGIIFILPYFFSDFDSVFQWKRFMRSVPEMLSFLLVFYLNYFVLIKQVLFKGKTKEFIFYNILLITGIALLMHYGYEIYRFLNPEFRPRFRRRGPSPWFFVIRNATSLLLMTGLSVAIRMSERWFKVENERKELERAKSEAELQNLKNQISPHFLLNTLNNIYALIEFDPPKAQTAVMELSKLLRHLLYDNSQSYVPLAQEMSFIHNYIELMRIRLADNVTVTTHMNVNKTSRTMIAPLIFISLIENAFKHGVSSHKPSFIDITLREPPEGKVEFICKNSYFPKTESDKSGSGIGLELVKKRLQLVYPGNYTWKHRIDGDVYTTTLIIDTKKRSE